jgi:hypothetical protein
MHSHVKGTVKRIIVSKVNRFTTYRDVPLNSFSAELVIIRVPQR